MRAGKPVKTITVLRSIYIGSVYTQGNPFRPPPATSGAWAKTWDG